jgi:hypothetical protein
MGLEDFIDEVKSDISEGISNVAEFLNTRNPEPVVKLGAEPSGNLTSAQIEAGQTGQAQAVVGQDNISSTANSSVDPGGFDFKKLALVGVGALALFWFLKRRSRG